MPWLAANSVSTAARWRPTRCTPPGASSSGKRPMSTGKVCQLPRPMASTDASRFPKRIRTCHWARQLARSEEHTSELQSHLNLVCRLLLEKKKNKDEHMQSNLSHHVAN